MPCFATTIVKISQVRLYVKDEINSAVVWAVGNYPIEQETNSMVIIMFVPIDPNKRDPDSQAVFEKDHYYVVSGKIVPEIYRGIKKVKMTISTSTCVKAVPNDENAVVKVSTNDYTTQNVNFVVNIVFPYTNSRFQHFKTSIRPTESLLFVVGELEIIKDNIYIYAKDINYVETHIEVKKQVFDSNNSQTSTMSSTSTRPSTSANTINLDDFEVDKSEVLLSNSRPAKRAKNKNVNEIAKNLLGVDNLEFAEVNDYRSEAPKDYDTTNEYFDGTRDSDMKDEEESSDDSFYTRNIRKEREV
ncbi:25553_t:CDS:2 [Gigaspora rosea]|nr:25553_t:CDS:2 [Gigaspora rosea]